MEKALVIPLPLAEMLYVVMGPMAEELGPNHPWGSLAMRILAAYRTGRDDFVEEYYSPTVALSLPILTEQVANEIADWIETENNIVKDLEMWKEEMDEHFFKGDDDGPAPGNR